MIGAKPFRQRHAVIDNERGAGVGADPLQRLGQPRELVLVDALDPQLERRDRPACQRGAQPVGKIVADVLRADQVQLARLAPRRRGKGRQVDLVDIVAVVIHALLISEAAAIVQ